MMNSSKNEYGQSALRALMPALNNKKYFNYGGQGPLPKPSLEAINKSWEIIQEKGPFTNDVFSYMSNELQITKELLSKLCGVKPTQIALTENVTAGCILPLWGLPFSSGDHFLISDCEHPGVVAACQELAKRKGIFIDILPVKQIDNGLLDRQVIQDILLNRLKELISPKTRLVVLSHLLWNTGQIMPIGAVSNLLNSYSQRPYLLVDAAQSFGHIVTEREASLADIYAFTGHKWACGPEGLGGVALSERVLRESRPTLIGWRSLRNENQAFNSNIDPYHQDSRKFEIATSCVPLLAGLRSSLSLLKNEGSSEERLKNIREKSAYLWENLARIELVEPILSSIPPSGLVSFIHKGKIPPKKLVHLLGRVGIWIRDIEDPQSLRACVHITTKEDEIRSLLEEVRQITT